MDPISALGVAGSVVGIASFGIQLSQVLYQFTSQALSATQSLNSILSGIYATTCALNQVHGILAEDIENLERTGRAIFFSAKAIEDVKGTADKCLIIFWRIEATITNKTGSKFEDELIQRLNSFNKNVVAKKGSAPISVDTTLATLSRWKQLRWPYIAPKLDDYNNQLLRLQMSLVLMFTVISLGAHRMRPNRREEDPKDLLETYSRVRRMAAQADLPQLTSNIGQHKLAGPAKLNLPGKAYQLKLENPAKLEENRTLPLGRNQSLFRHRRLSPSWQIITTEPSIKPYPKAAYVEEMKATSMQDEESTEGLQDVRDPLGNIESQNWFSFTDLYEADTGKPQTRPAIMSKAVAVSLNENFASFKQKPDRKELRDEAQPLSEEIKVVTEFSREGSIAPLSPEINQRNCVHGRSERRSSTPGKDGSGVSPTTMKVSDPTTANGTKGTKSTVHQTPNDPPEMVLGNSLNLNSKVEFGNVPIDDAAPSGDHKRSAHGHVDGEVLEQKSNGLSNIGRDVDSLHSPGNQRLHLKDERLAPPTWTEHVRSQAAPKELNVSSPQATFAPRHLSKLKGSPNAHHHSNGIPAASNVNAVETERVAVVDIPTVPPPLSSIQDLNTKSHTRTIESRSQTLSMKSEPQNISTWLNSIFAGDQLVLDAFLTGYIIKNGEAYEIPHSGAWKLKKKEVKSWQHPSAKQSWLKVFAFLGDGDMAALQEILSKGKVGSDYQRSLVHLRRLKENRLKFWKSSEALFALIKDLELPPSAPASALGDLTDNDEMRILSSQPRMNQLSTHIPGTIAPPRTLGPPQHLGLAPPPPGMPTTLGQKSVRINDLTPPKLLNEAACLGKLTSYAAFTIRKAHYRAEGEQPTWARAEVVQERLSQEDIAKQVEKLSAGPNTVAEKKAALEPYQQGQVSSLIDNLASKEPDRAFEWLLAQLDTTHMPLPSLGPAKGARKEETREVASLLVYAVRKPLREINPVQLFQNIERIKADRMRPLAPAGTRPPPPPPGAAVFPPAPMGRANVAANGGQNDVRRATDIPNPRLSETALYKKDKTLDFYERDKDRKSRIVDSDSSSFDSFASSKASNKEERLRGKIKKKLHRRHFKSSGRHESPGSLGSSDDDRRFSSVPERSGAKIPLRRDPPLPYTSEAAYHAGQADALDARAERFSPAYRLIPTPPFPDRDLLGTKTRASVSQVRLKDVQSVDENGRDVVEQLIQEWTALGAENMEQINDRVNEASRMEASILTDIQSDEDDEDLKKRGRSPGPRTPQNDDRRATVEKFNDDENHIREQALFVDLDTAPLPPKNKQSENEKNLEEQTPGSRLLQPTQTQSRTQPSWLDPAWAKNLVDKTSPQAHSLEQVKENNENHDEHLLLQNEMLGQLEARRLQKEPPKKEGAIGMEQRKRTYDEVLVRPETESPYRPGQAIARHPSLRDTRVVGRANFGNEAADQFLSSSDMKARTVVVAPDTIVAGPDGFIHTSRDGQPAFYKSFAEAEKQLILDRRKAFRSVRPRSPGW